VNKESFVLIAEKSGLTRESSVVIVENYAVIDTSYDATFANFFMIGATTSREQNCATIAGKSGLTSARSTQTVANCGEIIENVDATFATFIAIGVEHAETKTL
jgi:dUTPase